MFVTPSCHVRYPFLSCSLPLPARLVLTVIEHQEDGLGTEEVGCNKHQNLHHVLTIIGGKWTALMGKGRAGPGAGCSNLVSLASG